MVGWDIGFKIKRYARVPSASPQSRGAIKIDYLCSGSGVEIFTNTTPYPFKSLTGRLELD